MTIDFAALTRFLQKLVQIKTLSGAEEPGMALIATEMAHLGYEQIGTDAYGNLTGLIKGSSPGPTLLFDAHVDTVDIAPGVPWQHGPFAADIEAGRLYGRGAADMKGPLAAMLYAAAAADKSSIAGQIVISASVMEEVVEGWPLRPVIDQFQPDFVVIGEPTDLKLNHGGRGRAEIHLTAMGQPTHSSTPHLGTNAVLRMLPAIQAIEALEMPTDPELGTAVMALTDIISEPYPGHSMVPSRCRVTYDRRLLAGETEAQILAAIRSLPACAPVQVTIGEANYTSYTGATIRATKFFPAWRIEPDHDFVQAALAGLQQTGLTPSLGRYQFNTNATYTAGVAQIPTVGFGPSRESQAHIVDEYIILADLQAAARGYGGIIQSVLGKMR